MNLFAISDLHLEHRANREALARTANHPDDWLILAGDICSDMQHLDHALSILTPKFNRIIWVPGNHELWLTRSDEDLTSVEKYQAMVALCQRYGVSTPEDPYPLWQSKEGNYLVIPLFLLYDYSFSPEHVDEESAVAWATESGVLCRDEHQIDPAPFSSKAAWCRARLDYSRQRLEAAEPNIPMVLVNHFPLRYDLSRTMRIPRFSIWCGTRETENWHRQFPVDVVVSGHLHMRATDFRDGVRFEEVSLGYPKDWNSDKEIQHYFRKILPDEGPRYHHAGPFWKFRI